MLHSTLTITSHGGSLRPTWRILVLLRQDLYISPTELEDLLTQLSAALMSRLLHCVAQQHETPCQAKYQQQHAQLLGHVPPQECTQHGTGGSGGEGHWRGLRSEADGLVFDNEHNSFLFPVEKFSSLLSLSRERSKVKVHYKSFLELEWIQCFAQVNPNSVCAITVQLKKPLKPLEHPVLVRKKKKCEKVIAGSGSRQMLTPKDSHSQMALFKSCRFKTSSTKTRTQIQPSGRVSTHIADC